MAQLKAGDKAPDFALVDQHGKKVRLKDRRGRKTVVYFYPKANTSGCTAQSCALRDAEPDLAKIGADVIGISPDQPAAQLKFDEKGKIAAAFYKVSPKDTVPKVTAALKA